MSNYLVIGGHGVGDCILVLQCVSLVKDVSIDTFEINFATREEVFKPLKYFFKNFPFPINRMPEELGENNSILNNPTLINKLKSDYKEIYYVIPDLLYRNPLNFPFKKYNLSPHVIKQHRLSIKEWKPLKKIYIGLVTMAEHHKYMAIKPLIYTLAKRLPDYEIYFPNVKKWGGADLDWGDFSKTPDNVFVHEDPSFEDSIDHLRQSRFGIFADNGPSHFAYHLGMPRIVLDNFMGNPKWIARWREDPCESISLQTNVPDLVHMVEAQILHPQASLVPREMCKDSRDVPDLLGFKY